MRYPTLSLSDCEALGEKKIEGQSPNINAVWTGQGEAIDLFLIEDLASRMSNIASDIDSDVDRDQIEGDLSEDLFEVLCDLPIQVLDDPGFWRYLSIRYFWDFIAWREERPFAKGNFSKYINGRSNTEAVLNRMYLRAKAVGPDHLELAGQLKASADFWRSHVIRVSTGSAPALTRSFVRMQRDDRLMTSTLREFAKAINRTWSNIQLHLYSEENADMLLQELRDQQDQ